MWVAQKDSLDWKPPIIIIIIIIQKTVQRKSTKKEKKNFTLPCILKSENLTSWGFIDNQLQGIKLK
jgi:hypothetical protein